MAVAFPVQVIIWTQNPTKAKEILDQALKEYQWHHPELEVEYSQLEVVYH
jgi:hypothetical protein